MKQNKFKYNVDNNVGRYNCTNSFALNIIFPLNYNHF